MTADLVIVDAEVDGGRVDVEVGGGRIISITSTGDRRHGDAAERVEAGGAALIPGLHDHHIHLLAGAAARQSLDLHSSDVRSEHQLRLAVQHALSHCAPQQWLRIVGYHGSIAGELTPELVDRLVTDHPARVQHRTGMLWVLNRLGREHLGSALDTTLDGIERDATGLATGRLWRLDSWLRDQLPPSQPDLATLIGELRSVGITGVTDTTPLQLHGDVRHLVDAWRAAPLGMNLVVSTAAALVDVEAPDGPTIGPVKLFVDEHDPPEMQSVVEAIEAAHAHLRPVAVHAVTRAGLAWAVAAWNEAGARYGDRVEHAAVVPPDLRAEVVRLGLQVVTQPAFVYTRGDDYLADVAPDDIAYLWPCGSLIEAGIPVAAGSDAPYGTTDPWLAMATARTRLTRGGRVLGADEVVDSGVALRMYLGHPLDPGGPTRRVAVGEPADLCLLDRPLSEALAAPSRQHVVRTWSTHDPVQ
jgi:predicted amidohydrolase YtcJ